jgi:hypothetical protein
LKYVFKIDYSVVNSFSIFWKKSAKSCHNFLQYERVLQISYFHILNIAKVWLNRHMDYVAWAPLGNFPKKHWFGPPNMHCTKEKKEVWLISIVGHNDW